MKKKALLALIMSVVLLLTACGTKPDTQGTTNTEPKTETSAPPATEPSQRTVVDMQGRQVTIPAQVNKIICMGPSALRIVCYLQQQDKVVGVEDSEMEQVLLRPYNYVNDSLRKLPVVSKASKSGLVPYEEEILKVAPDVIFLAFSQVEIGEELQSKLGIPVVFANTNGDVFGEKWFDSLKLVASVLGCEERAEEIVSYTNKLISDMENRTEKITQRPVAYLGAISARGAHGLEGTIGDYPPFRVTNIQNAAQEIAEKGTSGRNGTVELEQILKWNPDFLFLNVENLGQVKTMKEENPDYFTHLDAVKNGKIYAQIAYNNYGGNLELAILNAYYAGSVVYPQAFQDVDLAAVEKDVFEFFLGRDISADLKEAGMVFSQLTLD